MRQLFFLLFFALSTLCMQGQPKYVFYFIGDGMGANQVNATELYRHALQSSQPGISPLAFTQLPVASVATTFSANSWVTDSAAAGTALACGEKTNNGAIGVDSDNQPMTSVASKAKKSGKKVGIASSVSIDHATPAAFYAHQPNRDMYYEIGLDILKSGFDFFAGSGLHKPDMNYLGEKQDNLYPMLQNAGYIHMRGYQEFQDKSRDAQKILLTNNGPDYTLPYAIDRKENDLTLAQITECAIEFLNNKKGFFLMVEGGRIDWACHSNDGATMIQEIQDFDEAIQVALDFYNKHPKETLIIVTADHETGGISLGNRKYKLNLSALQHQKNSINVLSDKISLLRKTKNNNVTWNDIRELLTQEMGFWEEVAISEEQEKRLKEEYELSFVQNKTEFEEDLYSKQEPMAACAKEILNEQSMLNWAHGSHTAGYVPVYAIGIGADRFKGMLDNTDIPNLISEIAEYE